MPETPTYEPLTIPTPHTAEELSSSKPTTGPTYHGAPVTMIYEGPTVNLTWIDVEIQEVEIGWSRGEVLTLLGQPDWTERQSTDFGYDVFLWYGDWAVETSDGYVTGVTWYG